LKRFLLNKDPVPSCDKIQIDLIWFSEITVSNNPALLGSALIIENKA